MADESCIQLIKDRLIQSRHVVDQILENPQLIDNIQQTVRLCLHTLRAGGTLYFCGNGGSFADAQHLAAELTGRFYQNRRPCRAEALASNPAYLTAVANVLGYTQIFARYLQGMARKEDIVIFLTTSGRSQNIVDGMAAAKQMGLQTVLMTCETPPNTIQEWTDILLAVPSSETPRIQESHKLIGHIICELIERELS